MRKIKTITEINMDSPNIKIIFKYFLIEGKLSSKTAINKTTGSDGSN